MNQFTFAEQLQAIKDVIQNHDDGMLTGFETTDKIYAIMSKVDKVALKVEHDKLMSEQE